MGEGLGAGGHATRRWRINSLGAAWFRLAEELFSTTGPTSTPGPRAPAIGRIARQIDLATIGKFEITRADAEPAAVAAATLDHVPRARREPAGETI
jgi:hypothetical protein